MRVSRDKLVALAREESKRRADSDGILSAYLIGSVASGEPIFGGSADIDLVLIHRNHAPIAREFLPLSKDFHLDILHHSSELYANPTELRIDPWLGPAVCEPIFLYDPEHFFERAQAGVRGQYYRADYMHARALSFLSRARKFENVDGSTLSWVTVYTQSLLEGANAAATLGGFPAAGRRLSPILHARLLDLEQENLYFTFQRLLGAEQVGENQLLKWLSEWQKAVEAASSVEDRFAKFRQNYHVKGFETLVANSDPKSVLWNLISEWNAACLALPNDDELTGSWRAAIQMLRLDEQDQEFRVEQLENYLDEVEAFIDNWAVENGA